MIAVLRGEIIEKGLDNLVIMVGGIGLRVFVPAQVVSDGTIGDTTYLHTYLVVREDALTLYGFNLSEAREFFVLLLGVNGVGPRIALAILSSMSLDAIRRAVLSDQPELFAQVSGVGKKTAQKIILHLQDKVGVSDGIDKSKPFTDTETELMAALTSLGYSIVESQTAIQSIPRDAPQDIESRLRIALQFFA